MHAGLISTAYQRTSWKRIKKSNEAKTLQISLFIFRDLSKTLLLIEN